VIIALSARQHRVVECNPAQPTAAMPVDNVFVDFKLPRADFFQAGRYLPSEITRW
jgi:hypothetical protein